MRLCLTDCVLAAYLCGPPPLPGRRCFRHFAFQALPQAICSPMLIIQIKDNETVDRALKRFKKKFERTGVLKELRRRTFFLKPSIKERKMKQKAVYKLATYGQPGE